MSALTELLHRNTKLKIKELEDKIETYQTNNSYLVEQLKTASLILEERNKTVLEMADKIEELSAEIMQLQE